MYKHTQRSFAGGQIDRELAGRQDLEKYFTGASKLQNFAVRRQGNVAKRRGTDYAATLTNILGTSGDKVVPLGSHRLLPLVCEREKGYYALLADGRAFLLDTARGIYCADGKWRRAVSDYTRPETGATSVQGEYNPGSVPEYMGETVGGGSSTDVDFENAVAIVGTTPKSTFKAAVDALTASPGSTMTLLQDVEISSAYKIKGTIDLNGHALTQTKTDVTMTFEAGAGVACGIISSQRGGKVVFPQGMTANGFTHTSGILTLKDISASFETAKATTAKSLLYSSDTKAADHIEITRCCLYADGSYGVIYLSNKISNQQETQVSDYDDYGNKDYSWFSGGCLIRGSTIEYGIENWLDTPAAKTSAANPAALMTNGFSATCRRFSFVSGFIISPRRPAANIGLFMYGGTVVADKVGINTSYAATKSRIVRGSYPKDMATTGYIADGSSTSATVNETYGAEYDHYDKFSFELVYHEEELNSGVPIVTNIKFDEDNDYGEFRLCMTTAEWLNAGHGQDFPTVQQMFEEDENWLDDQIDVDIRHPEVDAVDNIKNNSWRMAEWDEEEYVASQTEREGGEASDGDIWEGQVSGEGSPAPLVRRPGVPYCIAVAYSDAELPELDYFQSGDTLFLAHANHAPAKIVFDPNALTLAFSRLRFNAAPWSAPVLESASANVHPERCEAVSEDGWSKTYVSGLRRYTKSQKKIADPPYLKDCFTQSVDLPSRTISYVVTYVKDGQESPPSNPISVTYGAPWEQGGKVTLKFSKGANAEEPDYYNVYKKQSTEYGLIGTSSRPIWSDRSPTAFGWDSADNESLIPGGVPSLVVEGRSIALTEREDVLNERPEDAFDGAAAASGVEGMTVYCGCGGLRFGSFAVFSYGAESGVVADRLRIALDSHTLVYEEITEGTNAGKVRVWDHMRLSGASVKVRVVHMPVSGAALSRTAKESVYDVDAATLGGVTFIDENGAERTETTGERTRYCDVVEKDASRAEVKRVAAMALRVIDVSLLDFNSKGARQIVRVTVECRDENGDVCETVISGFAAGRAATGGKTFEDDYITPDMSLTPPAEESAFSSRGEYPSCVGVYQQRLVFAATANRPNAFWMSAVGDLYQFTPHRSAREDDAIEAEVAAVEFPRVNHLVFSRDLVMLGDGGEWRIAPVSGNALTFKSVSATLQSQIGSAKWLKPMTVGNEVVFAERTGMTLRSLVYGYSSDGYESTDLTVLCGDIFAANPIRRMCYKQHPDSTIVCVLADGTIAAMAYMKEHEVCAWSRHVLGGGARALDCATSKALNGTTTDVALTVAVGDGVELWRVRPDLPDQTVAAQLCMDGCREAADGTAPEGMTRQGGIDGWTFEAELVTVRPEPRGGTIQFELKNAKDVEVRTIGPAAWRAARVGLADHPTYAQRVEGLEVESGGVESGGVDSPTHPLTNSQTSRDVRLLLSGDNNGDGRIQIKSDDCWPLQILSISTNYEIQLLSESEG